MQIKYVYIANDGSEFQNKEDCIKYEKYDFLNSVLPKIKFKLFDDSTTYYLKEDWIKGIILDNSDINYCDYIWEFLSETEVIIFPKDCDENIKSEIFNRFSEYDNSYAYIHPESGNTFIRYWNADEDKYLWKTPTSILTELKEQAAAIEAYERGEFDLND